jgi:hypothetical protein
MPKGSKEQVVDSYIGLDDPVKIYDLVKQGLINTPGIGNDKAGKYAWFTQAVYKELMDQYAVVDGLNRIASANELLPEAMSMNLVKSTAALKDYRLSGGVAVVAPFVDRFAAIARLHGIEVNDCWASVAKVAIDIGGAGTGAVTSVSGFGIPLLALSVIATFNDSYSLGKACFQ